MKRQHHVERACAQIEAAVKVPNVFTECTLIPEGQEQIFKYLSEGMVCEEV